MQAHTVHKRKLYAIGGGGGRRSAGAEILVPSISQTKIITIGLSLTCPLKNATMGLS